MSGPWALVTGLRRGMKQTVALNRQEIRCCQILWRKKNVLGGRICGGGQREETRTGGRRRNGRRGGSLRGRRPLPSPPPLSGCLVDGWAHQFEIIRMNCSLVLLNTPTPGGGGQALKAGEVVSLYFAAGEEEGGGGGARQDCIIPSY